MRFPEKIKAAATAVCTLSFVFSLYADVMGAVVAVDRGASIAEAVRAAGEGDTVEVSAGEYADNIVIDGRVSLVARSTGVVLTPADAKRPVISIEGANGALVAGFTIKGATTHAIRVARSFGVRIVGNSISGSNTGIYVEHSDGSVVEGNTVTANEKGIYLYHSNRNTITRNTADSNVNNGILLHASHGNVIRENSASMNLWNGITLSSSNDNEVVANRAVKNTYAIVLGESTGNTVEDNVTMRRLYLILPVALVYVAIFLYLIERRLFMLYYKIVYKE